MTDGPLSEVEACILDAQEALTDALQLVEARPDAGTPMMQLLNLRLQAINHALGKAMTAEFKQAIQAETEAVEGESD